MKTVLTPYGKLEYRSWKQLENREIRYAGTDFEYNADPYDIYEIEDPAADDFGVYYATQLT